MSSSRMMRACSSDSRQKRIASECRRMELNRAAVKPILDMLRHLMSSNGAVYGFALDTSGTILDDGFNQIPIADCKETVLPQLALLCRKSGVTGLEKYVPSSCTTVVGTSEKTPHIPQIRVVKTSAT
mmetsp:Transcript_31005/g.59871  ORF Transcript_31005/g.59871 Transcript_31005/m.59871 type:complete len:127 (-) Transcript_31005:1705-2085(-)